MPTTDRAAAVDVHTLESAPNSNHHKQRWLGVRAGGGVTQRAFLDFTNIPPIHAQVQSAFIYVTLKEGWTGGPHDLTLRRVTGKWSQTGITFNNEPATVATNAVTVNITGGVDGQEVAFDVGAMFADVAAGQPFHGVRLTTSSAGAIRKIYSVDSAIPDFHPRLELTYSTVPDPPADMTPSGGLAVDLAKPTLTWHFRDADGDAQKAFQVQIGSSSATNGDGSLTTPTHDSGWVTSSDEQYPLATTGNFPTFVAAGTVVSGTGAVQPPLPAGIVDDDYLVVYAETNSAEAVTLNDTGYVHVPGSPVIEGTGTRLSVLYKRMQGPQTAPTVNDPGDHVVARMAAFRGGRTTGGNPFDVTEPSAETTSDTSGSITGDTTQINNALILLFAASGFDVAANDTAGYSAFTNAALANLTERTDDRRLDGGGGTLALATGEKSVAGAVGATTYTLASAAPKAHLMAAMRPEVASGPAFTDIPADAARFWVTRTQDENGNISKWSDVQSFTRITKGTFTLDSPLDGGTVEDASPVLTSTMTGRNQESIRYLLEEFDSDDNVWVPVWEKKRHDAPAQSGVSYREAVPDGYITKTGTNYRITVDAWDTVDRVWDGAPIFYRDRATFTFTGSATPNPVTSLTVAQEAGNGPGVQFTFNRAAGQPMPDYFALVANGKRIFTRIDPSDFDLGGDPIVYSFVWHGAPIKTDVTYSIEAVVLSGGVYKHSIGNASQTYKSWPDGIWFVDAADPTRPSSPSDPPRRFRLKGDETQQLAIGRSGATYYPIGRRDPIQIVDNIRGREGTLAGIIHADDAAGDDFIENFEWATQREQNIGRRWQLIYGWISIPVELTDSDIGHISRGGNQPETVQVSVGVQQVGDFR